MQLEKTYQIRIKILSEAIFTRGEKEHNLVQSIAQTDEYGFVFFHAKTLKGQLKRQALWLLKQYAAIDTSSRKERATQFYQSIVRLFGINKEETVNINRICNIPYTGQEQTFGSMRLSNLELHERIRTYFICQQEEDAAEEYFRLSPHDLIEAQTHVRTGIQLQDGVVKDKMMNTYHTIRKDLVFYSSISFEDKVLEYDPVLLNDLARIIYSFRKIGAGIHRGRGEIKSELIVDGEAFKFNKLNVAGRDKSGILSSN